MAAIPSARARGGAQILLKARRRIGMKFAGRWIPPVIGIYASTWKDVAVGHEGVAGRPCPYEDMGPVTHQNDGRRVLGAHVSPDVKLGPGLGFDICNDRHVFAIGLQWALRMHGFGEDVPVVAYVEPEPWT